MSIHMYPNQTKLLNLYRSVNSFLEQNNETTNIDLPNCPAIVMSSEQDNDLKTASGTALAMRPFDFEIFDLFDKWENILLSSGANRCHLVRVRRRGTDHIELFMSSVQSPPEFSEEDAFLFCHGVMGFARGEGQQGISIGVSTEFNADDLLQNERDYFDMITIQEGKVIHSGEMVKGELLSELLMDAQRVLTFINYVHSYKLHSHPNNLYTIETKGE